MGNWAKLCEDILRLIVDKFLEIEDIAQFGAVCHSWRLVSIEKWHFSIASPWLMLVEKEDSDKRDFYSLSTKNVYRLDLAEARGRKCWSSYGWLITLGLDMEIHTFNPFSRSRALIRLPPQPTLPNQYDDSVSPEYVRRIFITKVILSSRPTLCDAKDEKCMVMGIFSEYRKLAFLRLGDEAWTPVHTPKGGINDVVYLNGQFYGIADHVKLVIVDTSIPNPKTIEIAEPPEEYRMGAKTYLVESEGELFLVARKIFVEYVGRVCNERQFAHETKNFEVYKFNFNDKKWTKLESLENRALFVGANASFAIFPSNHPGVEPNCIYFTDDGLYGIMKDTARTDMGLFQVETKKFDNHYVGPDILTRVCAPLWICPSL